MARSDFESYKEVKGAGDYYLPKKDVIATLTPKFPNADITTATKFFRYQKDYEVTEDGTPKAKADFRKVWIDIPESKALTCWVKRTTLGEVKGDIVDISAEINECYKENPNTPNFEKEAGKVVEESAAEIKGIESLTDGSKNLWYKVKAQGEAGQIEGWIADNDPKLVKISAFDWQGFNVIKEDGDNAYDPLIDFDNLSPFFKKVIDQINTDADKKNISKEEILKALKDERLSSKLSRLICYNPSEWWTDSECGQWERVFSLVGKPAADRLKERLLNLCWWDKASQKSKAIPSTPNWYHWHPVAFVEQMKILNKEPDWLTIARQEIGQKEISGSKHNSRIIEYHKTTTLPESLYNDETAWCSSFVNWCFKQAGYVGTNSAWAKDWIGWGKLLTKPAYGAVAVVDYGKDKNGKDRGGHVGFVVGKKANGKILILGGNQGKQGQGSVNEKPFGTGSIAGYVLPSEYDFVNYDLEIKESIEEEGTYENTR